MEKTKNMILCSMFTVLIIVGTIIKIPTPIIPITLQVCMVLLGGILLGAKLGATSSILFLLLGLIGLPVFTSGGGFGYIIHPTFGYIIGFIIGAFVTGKICEGSEYPSFVRIYGASLAGIFIIYTVGFLYFLLILRFVMNNTLDLWGAFLTCILIPLPSDLITCFAGALLAKRIMPIVKNKLI